MPACEPLRSWRMYCYRLLEMRAQLNWKPRVPGPGFPVQNPEFRGQNPKSRFKNPEPRSQSILLLPLMLPLLWSFHMALKKTPCSYLRIGLRLLPATVAHGRPHCDLQRGWSAERGYQEPFNAPGNAHRNFSTLTLVAFCRCCCCWFCGHLTPLICISSFESAAFKCSTRGGRVVARWESPRLPFGVFSKIMRIMISALFSSTRFAVLWFDAIFSLYTILLVVFLFFFYFSRL